MTIAAGLLALILAQAGAAPAAQAPASGPHLSGVGQARFEQCAALIDHDAARAYEEGMAWAAETHEIGAYRCAAMALVEENRADEGARRFEQLAGTMAGEDEALRAEIWSQAGNAWLLAHEPSQARGDFTRAIALMQGSTQFLPDILIDRARAYAAEGDYRHAEEDLSHALDMRPQDALALRLRADARLRQNSFDLAQADAEAAVALEPTNIDALLMLGHAHEAKRTGQLPVGY